MKITKRFWHSSPKGTINLWLIPTLFYTIQKVAGSQFNGFEWMWWVGILSMTTLWFFINFKLVK